MDIEVDTGSDGLILNEIFIDRLKILRDSLKRVEGKDETDHDYVRYFGKLGGPIRIVSALDAFEVGDLPVMFQKIIYDGLVGDAVLKRYAVTFDLPHSEMIFSFPAQ